MPFELHTTVKPRGLQDRITPFGNVTNSPPIHPLGPPTHSSARPKIPVQFRRVSIRTFVLDLLRLDLPRPPESVQHQDRLQKICGAVLLRLRRRQ